MTTSAYTILVVDRHIVTRPRILGLLRRAGYSAIGATTVEAALGLLGIFPVSLVIVSLLARDRDDSISVLDQIRARRPEVPTIALTHPINPAEFLNQVAQFVMAPTTRRWPRKSVPSGLSAQIGDYAANVVNVSYGGLRFELERPLPWMTRALLIVELPPFDLAVQARPVWGTGPETPGPWRCGAELAENDETRVRLWRTLVDLLPKGDLPGPLGA